MSDGNSLLLVQTTFPNDGRRLKGFIMGLVKGKIAVCVQRLNYVKSYTLQAGEYTKTEEKLLLIKILSGNKERLESYIKKNHPYDTPELVYLEPKDVGSDYLTSLGVT